MQVTIERRTLPGETGADVEAELAAVLERAVPDARQRTLLVREPFEVDAADPLVGVVRDAGAATLVAPPAVAGASYWADAAFIAAAGIPTVMFGPAGEGAHAAEEWVSIASTEAVTRTLAAVAATVCA